ncbi:hypothetical protein D3C87_2205650 [compost metagenome]
MESATCFLKLAICFLLASSKLWPSGTRLALKEGISVPPIFTVAVVPAGASTTS